MYVVDIATVERVVVQDRCSA